MVGPTVRDPGSCLQRQHQHCRPLGIICWRGDEIIGLSARDTDFCLQRPH